MCSLYNCGVIHVSLAPANMTANGTDEEFDAVTALTALGVIHVLVVVVPTQLLGAPIVFIIHKHMRRTGINPVTLLYLYVTVVCMLGTIINGFLLDVSLITGSSFLGNCTNFPVNKIQLVVYFGFHTALAMTVGVIAVTQFLTLRYGKIVKSTFTTLLFSAVVFASFGLSCIFFNGQAIEIRGSVCKSNTKAGATNAGVWTAFAYAIPLAITILFSTLTCTKVKNAVSTQQMTVVASVVKINAINIAVYVVFRLCYVTIFYTSVGVVKPQAKLNTFTIIARYVNDLIYPATLASIVLVHKGLRSTLNANCGTLAGYPEQSTPDDSGEHMNDCNYLSTDKAIPMT